MMAIDVYWGSGSPYSWRVLLALEYKRLPYTSHVLQFSKAAARRLPESAGPPVRRIGAFVTGQAGDAREPAPERGILHFDRHEA